MIKKPDWLKVRYAQTPNRDAVEAILESLGLNTVCSQAACPNYSECFSKKTATFMILGTNCTRNCRFCNVRHGSPTPVDNHEPQNVAKAVKELGLRYAVITSVTRDDLPDGGAGHFANVISAIKKTSPGTAVEVLIPDFTDIKTVIESTPTVIGHNIETVESLYPIVRAGADYRRSLEILRNIKELGGKSKTGIMLGMGETKYQIKNLLDDLRSVGCDFLTIGQYLAPSKDHYPVKRYIEPSEFDEYGQLAKQKGFSFVASAPFVRSSYNAEEALNFI